MTAAPFIVLNDLAMTFREGEGERVILRGAAMTQAKGEFVALLGRSGSGKSTLLNLLSGILKPDHGRVIVDGIDLTALGERDRTLFRRHRIGFVFQFFNLIPTLTIAENLMLPLELVGKGGSQASRKAAEMLVAVELGGRGQAFPDTLSGGEQQRVAIARALIHDPDVILADEPTGNLDEDSATTVLDLLDGLVRERAKTLLAVTHAAFVAARADRILTLRDHRLIEQRPSGIEGWVETGPLGGGAGRGGD